jgi:hypothetical protein
MLVPLLGFFLLKDVIVLCDLQELRKRLSDSQKAIEIFLKKIETLPYLKSTKKIFNTKIDPKQVIEKISGRLKVHKTLVKQGSSIEEIKILSKQEDVVYRFIEDLLFELPGIIQFESIKISKNNKELSATIQLKAFQLLNVRDFVNIDSSDEKSDTSSIKLFFSDEKRKHNLLCTLEKAKAYINNSWFQLGDAIEDRRLIGIYQNYIELQRSNGDKTIIKLGEMW